MGECRKTSVVDMWVLKKRELTDFKYQGKLSKTLKLDQYEKPIDNLITHLYSLKKISDFDIFILLFNLLI